MLLTQSTWLCPGFTPSAAATAEISCPPWAWLSPTPHVTPSTWSAPTSPTVWTPCWQPCPPWQLGGRWTSSTCWTQAASWTETLNTTCSVWRKPQEGAVTWLQLVWMEVWRRYGLTNQDWWNKKKSGLFKSWILYFVCFIEIIPCTLSGDSTIYWVKPINSTNTLFSQVLLAFHFSLSPTKHFSPSAQVCHQHWPVFYDLSNRNTSKILFVCTTLLSIKIISSMTCETLLGFPGAVWVILSVLLPPACCLVKPWVQSSSQDAECWPGGRWMASTTWALQYNKYRWKDPVWLQTAVITTGRCLDNSTLLVLCPFQHNWLKWNNDHEACFKGYVHPKMIIQSLSTYPYISGPQNVSGDSCQNSVASFSETPETDGDFFIKH